MFNEILKNLEKYEKQYKFYEIFQQKMVDRQPKTFQKEK